MINILSIHHAAEELNVTMGVINTLVLLVSSVTMELARRHYRTAPGGAAFNRWLSVTMVLA